MLSVQFHLICIFFCRLYTCQFTHCFVGHVGSVRDQRIFHQKYNPTLEIKMSKFSDECHLIGDQAYKLYENLLVPHKDNGHLTERQRNYNFLHSSARVFIERAFALLHFRSLLTVLAMIRINFIPIHIFACCVHNLFAEK